MWINQQRRIFRGEGGATDRRLPKHNARRRRKNRNNTNHHNESIDQTENNNTCNESVSHSLSCDSPTIITAENDIGTAELFETNHSNGKKTAAALNNHEGSIGNKIGGYDSANPYTSCRVYGSKSPLPPSLVEIKHLKRRIKNVQEISIQTSRDAIASDLTKYQNNVLNATHNCVNEWRGIARNYNIGIDNDCDSDGDNNGISSALRREVGLVVFQLIQLSVQSGPLSGSKPGYFQRCGAEVARVVLDYLEDVVPQHDALGVEIMGFTSKQMDTMKKWKVRAGKAIENDKSPSKSVMKKLRKKGKQKKTRNRDVNESEVGRREIPNPR